MTVLVINDEAYLSAKEAAKFLGISSTTFVQFQRDYKLQWITRRGLGQIKLFRKKDLEPLLQFTPGTEMK